MKILIEPGMSQLATKASSSSPKAGQSDFSSTFALASASEETPTATTVEAANGAASGNVSSSRTEEAGALKKKASPSSVNASETNPQLAPVPFSPAAVIVQSTVALPIVASPAESTLRDGSSSGGTSSDAEAAVNLPTLSTLESGPSVDVAQAGTAGLATDSSATVVPGRDVAAGMLSEAPAPSSQSAPVVALKKATAGSVQQLQQKDTVGTPTPDTKELRPASAAAQSMPSGVGLEGLVASARLPDAGQQHAAVEPVQAPERVSSARQPDAPVGDKHTVQSTRDPQSALLALPGNNPVPAVSVSPMGATTGAESGSRRVAGSSGGGSSSIGANLSAQTSPSGAVQQSVATKGKTGSFDPGMKSGDDTNSGANAKGTDAVAPIHQSQVLPAAGLATSAPISPAAGQATQQLSEVGPAAVQSQTGQLAGSDQSAPARSTAAAAPVVEADVHAMSSVSNAQLIQSAQHSEMRVGMQSAEFGNISISTSLNHQALSAQISTDHLELGRALAVHMPAIEEKLSSAYGVQARVEVRDGGNSGASSSYSNSGQQSNEGRQSRSANALNALSTSANQRMPLVGSTTGSIAAETSRLDIRV